MSVRMIVTDLDGTLLLPDKTVTDRTVRAILAAQDAGIVVLAATGRSIVDARKVLPEGLGELAVCSNGAVVYAATTDTVLLERAIDPQVIAAFLESLRPAAPGTRFAALVNSGYEMLPGPGYLRLMRQGDHGRDVSTLTEVELTELVVRPAVKLVARHSELDLDELLARCEQAAGAGVLPTTSGVPFIEMSAAGVSKASTLDLLAAERGISAGEVLAFGDSANDVEMIRWAGHGVAMANGVTDALAAADEIAPANTHEGVAVVIERLLGL